MTERTLKTTDNFEITEGCGVNLQSSYSKGAHQLNVIQKTALYAASEGDLTDRTPWTKIGYLPSFTKDVNTDVWSYGAVQPVYLFPSSDMQMEVTSSSSDDTGTELHSGTSTGGTTTSLISTGENFLTNTAVGDAIILDKDGALPEFGYITAIVSNEEIQFSGGLSNGGSGIDRDYIILDKSATVGAHAVMVNYLDGDYEERREIIILNGTAVIPTVNTDLFRINSFRVIAAGANAVPSGNLFIRNLSNTPVYSFITAGYNRARNIMYTVPAGKILFVTDFDAGYATSGSPNKEYARITTRANIDPTTKFNTDGLFYPFTDVLAQNVTVPISLEYPTKLPAKTDIKVSEIGSASGVIIVTLRGYLKDE